MISLSLSLGISIYLARRLGPESFGVYAFAIAIFTILQPLSGGGIGTFATRELASTKDEGGDNAKLFANLVAASAAKSIAVGIALIIFVHLTKNDTYSLLNLGILILLGFSLTETLRGVFVGQNQPKFGQFTSEVLKPALFLIGLVAFPLLVTRPLTPVDVITIFGISSTLCFLCILSVLRSKMKFSWVEDVSRDEVLRIIRGSLPFAIISAMQYFNARVDVLFIGLLLSDADVGYYQIASRLGLFIALPGSLIAVLTAPKFSAAYKTNSKRSIRKIFFAAQIGSILLAIPICMTILVAGPDLITTLYGKAYLAAVPPLIVLSLSNFIYSLRANSEVLLAMTFHERKVMSSIIFGVVGNAILNVLLIPKYGTLGAAYATSFMGLSSFGLLLFFLYRSQILSRN